MLVKLDMGSCCSSDPQYRSLDVWNEVVAFD